MPPRGALGGDRVFGRVVLCSPNTGPANGNGAGPEPKRTGLAVSSTGRNWQGSEIQLEVSLKPLVGVLLNTRSPGCANCGIA